MERGVDSMLSHVTNESVSLRLVSHHEIEHVPVGIRPLGAVWKTYPLT